MPCQKDCANSSVETLEETGDPMANHGEVAYTTADGNDYIAHEQTYEGFIKLVKYGSAAVAIILILMAFFLT